MANPLKTKLQVAIQRPLNTGGGMDQSVLDPFMDWFNRSRKHILFTAGVRYEPMETSALLTHHIGRYMEHTPVYCPVLLLDRFHSIPGGTSAVYIYDLHLLGLMDDHDVLRFLSYMKYALMCDIRFIMAVPKGITLPDLDSYFKNKKATGMVARALHDHKSCTVMEV